MDSLPFTVPGMDPDKPAFDLYATVARTILDALERGVAPWRKPWHLLPGLPCNAVTQRPYRGVNAFLLGLAPYADHRWLTFRQVEEAGGRVRKGEPSTLVVFWKHRREDEEEKGGEKRRPPVLRYFRVFNAEQTEGTGLPALHVPEPLSELSRIQRAEILVRTMPDPPAVVEGARLASYSPGEDLVRMPPLRAFERSDDYYGTLFHELGHATGHAKRLARPGVCEEAVFGSDGYGREELVAELTSAFCCASAGLDRSLVERSASYVQGWLSVIRADPKAVVYAAAQAQRAADLIRGVTYRDA